MDISPYLKLLTDKKADRLSFKIGSPPLASLGSKTMPIGKTVLDGKLTKEIAFGFLDEPKKKELLQNKTITFDYANSERFIFSLTVNVETEGVSLSIQPALEASGVALDELTQKKRETVAAEKPQESGLDGIQVLGAMPEGDFDILPYLYKLIELQASDLFVTAGSSIKAKVSGRIIELDGFLVTPALARSAAFGIMTQVQRETFEITKDLDFAIATPDGKARFRVNAFYQRGTISLVMRLIPSKIPDAKDMGLPEILTELVMLKRGLLLVVGGTGTGKSTTLAAMINHRNANSQGHILTIEDPIEFSHPNLRSIVNQREVGIDSVSYARALKASLRESPDVILIGEIRDEETLEAALELANTGHLCISTMHANNANQAMERIINMFPQVRHKQLLMDLSTNLHAVVSQRLVPDVKGLRVAAIEVMINTPHISSLILKGDLYAIKDAMATSGTKGMKTFDHALYDLYKEGKISLEETLKNADSQNDMEAKINFG